MDKSGTTIYEKGLQEYKFYISVNCIIVTPNNNVWMTNFLYFS